MTELAQKILDAFCGELTRELTDDMREALATSIREIANEFQYDSSCWDESVEHMVLDARDLYDLATEIENL